MIIEPVDDDQFWRRIESVHYPLWLWRREWPAFYSAIGAHLLRLRSVQVRAHARDVTITAPELKVGALEHGGVSGRFMDWQEEPLVIGEVGQEAAALLDEIGEQIPALVMEQML